MPRRRFAVVGGGIIGVAVARQLALADPNAEVTLLEKENRLAAHQSGRNSGVVHSGIYYLPGSLKARLCRRGVGLLRDYCRERGLPYDECGKLIVARNDHEAAKLAELQRRGERNGVPGIRRLDARGLAAIEPNASGIAALHSPTTAITDFAAVTRSLAEDLTHAGGRVRLRTKVTQVQGAGAAAQVLIDGAAERFDRVVLCAGLHGDRLARGAGDTRAPMIVPFRGEYLRLVPERAGLVRGLLYPVPDPRYPFLGVHFTRRVDGGVDVGPNAILALAREGYRRRDLDAGDLLEMLAYPGFRRMALKHWRTGAREAAGSLSKRAYVAQARSYLPDLRPSDLVPAAAGVRAQAVDANGALIDEFRISQLGPVIAVRNAPSPGATASLAIAEEIAARAMPR